MNKTTLSSYASKLNSLGGMIDVLSKFGSAYNPSNPNLSVAKLSDFKTSASLALERVMLAETEFRHQAKLRVELFNKQYGIITRIFGNLKSLGIQESEYANLYLVARHIKGYKKLGVFRTETESKEKQKHTGAYVTVERRTDEFLEFITYLEKIPAYKPNQPELEIAALHLYHQELVQSNRLVMENLNTLNNERKLRDHQFLNEIDGIVFLGRMVKSDVVGTFGYNSAESKMLAPFKFSLSGKK